MRPRIDPPETVGLPRGLAGQVGGTGLREAAAVAELFIGVFRRDVLAFFPHVAVEPDGPVAPPHSEELLAGPRFRLLEAEPVAVVAEIFGRPLRLVPLPGTRLGPRERRMVEAIGAVLTIRYHHLFRDFDPARLDLYRGGSEDHYVAAFVEPEAYVPPRARPSRIASTVQTLRTAALSTYENRRVSTGALLLAPSVGNRAPAPDAVPYGVELTSLKSIHRLCDGRRTVFAVDPDGKLAEVVDIIRFADELPADEGPDIPCVDAYRPHARATRAGGHVCVVLSPNQEIKLFASGSQAFVFAHGRWRILDPAAKYASWCEAVEHPALARALFQAALNLAEARQGALLVVVNDPCAAIGRLVATHDVLHTPELCGHDAHVADPLGKRALHYLARGKSITELDPSVIEALAGIDGALVVDRAGRILAFGAILKHADAPGVALAEGARTTAAIVAGRHGPVLKVSEDGVVSCFLRGERVWDL